MNEQQLRKSVVDVMRGWLGWSEANGKYKAIIDLYNSQKPLPQGYKVKYSDEWCAATVTAAGMKAGLSDIIFGECSCSRMVSLYQKAGRWMEDDAYKPQIGDIVMYRWDDGPNYATTDNTAAPNHVGIVAEVNGNILTIIEGNKGEKVATRSLFVNGRYIRGYCLPDYASKAAKQTKEEDDDMDQAKFNEMFAVAMDNYRKKQAAKAASPWAQNAGTLDQAKAAGISDGTRPQDLLTREEGMAMALGAIKAAKK